MTLDKPANNTSTPTTPSTQEHQPPQTENHANTNNTPQIQQPPSSSSSLHQKELHIAPMLDVSFRDFRYFFRLMTKHAVLWTEMIVDETILHCGYKKDHAGTNRKPEKHKKKKQQQQHSDKNDENEDEDEDEAENETKDEVDEKEDEKEEPPISRIQSLSPQGLAQVDRHLGFHRTLEPPVICQLGGNNPTWTHDAIQMMKLLHYNYNEINLNCECPSKKVATRKQFGAALMKDVEHCRKMVVAMQRAVQNWTHENANSSIHHNSLSHTHTHEREVPVSIKVRIGIDNQDSYSYLYHYIHHLAPHCKRFYLHARKVYTKGLSPAQNRAIPPLNYPWVYRICEEFGGCEFWINGGIRSLKEAKRICFGFDDGSGCEGSGCEGAECERNGNEIGEKKQVKEMDQDGYYVSANGNADTANAKDHHDSNDAQPTPQPRQHGMTPCQTCNKPHGSCTAPPLHPPANLRGCMMGRAAMDHPALFALVDTDFYGYEKNPSKNRREVLVKYAEYLEERYPRQCCLNGDGIAVEEGQRYCCLCLPKSQALVSRPSRENNPPSDDPNTTNTNNTTPVHNNEDEEEQILEKRLAQPIRMSPRIIDRALKPTMGFFYGLDRGNKRWRRRVDVLCKDKRVRNCGPAFVIRKSLEDMPEELLDVEFGRECWAGGAAV